MSKPSGINCNCNTTVSDMLYRPEQHNHPGSTGAPGESGTAGTKSYPYDCYPNYCGEVGWICPVCGRGLSPSTSYCPCNLTRNITYLNGGLSLQDMSIDCNTTPPEAYYTTTATNGEDWIKADGKLHCPGGALNF